MAVRYQSQIDYGQVGRSIEQDLQRAQQFAVAGVETFVQNRLEQQRFANTVLENIDSLKDEGDIAHQQAIGAKVDELYNKAKDSIYKYRTTKKGKVKFSGYDFDPEVMREIKNEARNIKNAALRSEQLRGSYDQALKVIATDPTIINKTKAIEEATATFKDGSILFKGDSTSPDNAMLAFNKVIENNVDLRSAIDNTVSALAGGRTTDVGYTTADGKSEVIKYNVDYFTPQYSGNKVSGFTENKEAIDRLARDVYNSREGIASRTTLDEVRREIVSQLSPLSQLRMVEQKMEVPKPTEADTKRLLEANRYQDTVQAFQGVGSVINRGEYPTEQDYARINRSAGKEALKNVEFVNLPDIKQEYEQGSENILEVLREMDNKEINKLITQYEESGDTAKVTTGLETLIEGARDVLGEKSKYEDDFASIDSAYSAIQPLQQYVTKDFGILVKDKRGKDTKRVFVESSDDLSAFSSTVFDVPLTFSTEGQKATIPGF